jgi:hypothetical protein
VQELLVDGAPGEKKNVWPVDVGPLCAALTGDAKMIARTKARNTSVIVATSEVSCSMRVHFPLYC